MDPILLHNKSKTHKLIEGKTLKSIYMDPIIINNKIIKKSSNNYSTIDLYMDPIKAYGSDIY